MKFQELKPTTRLLTICSARMRPHKLLEMLESFDKTHSDFTEIVIYVWRNDPMVNGYREALKGRNVIYGAKRYMGEVLNYISTEVYPQVEYYQNINDDHYYLVEGWDKMMLKPLDENDGWGISYCTGLDEKSHPNAEVVSGKIVRTLGYYVHPRFRQYGLEPYFIGIGEGIKRFFHIKGEVIDHRSINLGYFERDTNYDFIYSDEEKVNGRVATIVYDVLFKANDLMKLALVMDSDHRNADLRKEDENDRKEN